MDLSHEMVVVAADFAFWYGVGLCVVH